MPCVSGAHNAAFCMLLLLLTSRSVAITIATPISSPGHFRSMTQARESVQCSNETLPSSTRSATISWWQVGPQSSSGTSNTGVVSPVPPGPYRPRRIANRGGHRLTTETMDIPSYRLQVCCTSYPRYWSRGSRTMRIRRPARISKNPRQNLHRGPIRHCHP